jgi:hypothetical protein
VMPVRSRATYSMRCSVTMELFVTVVRRHGRERGEGDSEPPLLPFPEYVRRGRAVPGCPPFAGG